MSNGNSSPVENTSSDVRAHDLRGAFDLFNQLSEQLTGTYQDLENQVSTLSHELSTARNERLQQLAEKEVLANRLQRLLAALPAGVVVLDGDGIVQDANPVAISLLDEPLLGQPWRDIVARAFSVAEMGATNCQLRDGRIVDVQLNSLGNEPGQIIVLTDITEDRRIQEQLNRHQRLTSMGEMAAKLAHQFRTPLASSLLYSSQLLHSELDDETRERFGERIYNGLHQLDKLVNDMLAFTRGGQSGGDQISVNALLDELAVSVQAVVQKSGTHLQLAALNEPAVINGNLEALLGALQNLVVNAIQASNEQCVVQVIASRIGEQIKIEIVDNGPGIPAGIQEQIFEPFFTTRKQGTGLGLAVVLATVRAHGGELMLQSVEGTGTRFTICLPIGDSVNAVVRENTEEQQSLTEQESARYRKR